MGAALQMAQMAPVAPARFDAAGSVVGKIIRRTAVEFEFDRQPDPAWIRLLRERFPKSRAHGWPYITWEPGDPWVPGARWVVYEMLHPWLVWERFLNSWVLFDELDGPHPRSDGHMCWGRDWKHTSFRWPRQFQCLCRSKLDAWKGGPCSMVSLTQWRLWRETGCVGFPMWVIQGTKGGHLFEYDKYQQQMLSLEGLAIEPPPLGALPYAPFDMRVVEALERNHALKRLGVSLSEYRRMSTAGWEQHKLRVEKEMRAQWVKHLSDQNEDDVNGLFISAAKKGELDNSPRTDIDYERVEEASTEHFIESGRMLAPQEVPAPTSVSSFAMPGGV